MDDGICSKCGRRNDGGYVFCPNCGEKFPDEPITLRRYVLDENAPLGSHVTEQGNKGSENINTSQGLQKSILEAKAIVQKENPKYPWTLMAAAPFLILYHFGLALFTFWLTTQAIGFSWVLAGILSIFLTQLCFVLRILFGSAESRYLLTGTWLLVTITDLITGFTGLKVILLFIMAFSNVLLYLPQTNVWFDFKKSVKRNRGV